MRVERHLERAIAVARTSTQRQRHGVVLTLGGKVLAVGVNTHRNHPTVCAEPASQASFHAEVAALRALRTTVDTSRLSLYSARVNAKGEPRLGKPCKHCMLVLELKGITDIYWTEGFGE